MQRTYKKQKVTGIQEYINKDTGEVVPMVVSEIEDKDFSFHKVWMRNFLITMEEISNKKMTVAFWIIDHLDKENKFTFSQRDVAQETGISLDTVSKTITLLQKGNFLRKIGNSRYIINPDILYKGSHKSRMGIVFDYSKCSTFEENHPELTDTEIETDTDN